MNNWLRLWHDMPTDPKWRVVARKSGQRIGDVIAVFNFLLVEGSANATERGRTHADRANANDDIAAALDIDTAAVTAIIEAMQGKVLDGDMISGWEKRQPKREDGSAERAKEWRERNRTQPNAPEHKTRPDQTREDKTPLPPNGGGSLRNGAEGLKHVPGLSAQVMLRTKQRAEELNRDYGKLCQTYNAWTADVGQPGNVDDAFPKWIESYTKGERL
jgi:hypothetical protein